jgi:FkbM family methyltransferase
LYAEPKPRQTVTAAVRRLARISLGPAQLNEADIARAALKNRRGVMLDVGAHYGSSLAPFASDGWSIHAFEPDPANRAELEAAFGRRPNVTIVPKGVSDEPGKRPLFTSGESSGISSLAPFTKGHRSATTVEVITLRDYMAEAGITTVDFLKVDVEGFERNVLKGYDWAIKPEIIVLEFEDSKTVPLGYSWKELADELVTRGYQVLVSEWFPIERYGVGHHWRRFARYPTELADPAAWGNLIAATNLDQVTSAADRALTRVKIRQRAERIVRRRKGSTRPS